MLAKVHKYLLAAALVAFVQPASALAATSVEGSSYYMGSGIDGVKAQAQAVGDADIGGGQGWLFSGAYLYTNSYSNWIGVGFVENHSWLGMYYWKRVAMVNQKNGVITFWYPPYDPTSPSWYKTYEVYFDSGVYKGRVGGQWDGHVETNYNPPCLEADVGCIGVYEDRMRLYKYSEHRWFNDAQVRVPLEPFGQVYKYMSYNAYRWPWDQLRLHHQDGNGPYNYEWLKVEINSAGGLQ